MSDNGQPEASAKPRIVIEFAGPGMADNTIAWSDGVTTGQLYGAAWVLDAAAREIRAGEVARSRGPLVAAPFDLGQLLNKLAADGGKPPPHEAHG